MSITTELDKPVKAPPSPTKPTKRDWLRRRKSLGLVAAAFVLVFLLLFVIHHTHQNAAPTARPVAVAKANRENLSQTLTLAAEFRPYQQVSLHAKVAGYVKWISVDVGDRVKLGQEIAELEVPEVENDLEKDMAAVQASREEVTRAQASYQEIHLASTRLETVAQHNPKLVAQQEVDDARAKDENAAGALAASKQHVDEANAQLRKTQAFLSFAQITVPFDAVVTHRYADTGALIQAGTSTSQTMPVVDVEQESVLRLVFPVPESAVAKIKVGQIVNVSVTSLHLKFDAPIARFADKVDRETRTMHTEVDVQNSDGRFKPGMYADATFAVEEHNNALSVPVEAVATGETPSVLLVNRKGIVESRPVTLGMATPSRFEIVKGLSPGDLVVVGSRAGIRPGEKVDPKIVSTPKWD